MPLASTVFDVREGCATTARPYDAVRAALVGLAAGGVYVSTMFPGLAAIGDTPKFQFVGAVLGTPHSPGYPLYMLLSWVFSRLPIGTLAYRMNLMSAFFGAVAVALVYGVLRQLGCRAWIAAGGALAIGFGRVFWSQALLAEVYTLNATIFAGLLLFLLRWSRTRRDRDLIAAIAFVAAGAAHHLTLVMTVPILTAYALAVDRRRSLSPRIVAPTVLLAIASLSTYGYLWLRTVQGAPFLEVQPKSIGDLLVIMRADSFDQFLGQLTMRDILRERVPLIGGWLFGELGIVGVLLLVPGFMRMVRDRWRECLLVTGIVTIIVAFALDYVVYDVEVFLLLAMMCLGIVAAIGLEAVASIAADRLEGTGRYLVAAVLAAVIVNGQFRANRVVNNQHRHVYENELFDALFHALPDRSAIVRESYPIDHMVLYKLIGEHAAAGRTIVLIPPDPAAIREHLADGYHVYAFHDHRQDMEDKGIEFVDASLPLPTARSLTHILDTECFTMGYPLGEAVRVGDPQEVGTSGHAGFNPAVKVHR
jgi:transmembrane protein TMEM260 (protein O-mannosyltransferase)